MKKKCQDTELIDKYQEEEEFEELNDNIDEELQNYLMMWTKKISGLMVYQIQQLKFIYSDFIVHFNLGEKINHGVPNNVDNLFVVSKQSKFVPVFILSNGDKGSNSWHAEVFKKYEQDILNWKNVFEIIDSLGDLIKWPTADLMLLLKN